MTIPALRHLARPYDDASVPLLITQPFGFNNPTWEPSCWNYGAGLYGFHWEPNATEGNWHLGTDYGLGCGTPLLAPAPGIVHSAGHDDTGFGLCTILDHGSGLYTLVAHQSRCDVSVGQQISDRQQIGLSGGDAGNPYNSGNSTGCHLHFATLTPDGRGYWYFFDPQLFIGYQPLVPVVPPPSAPAPTAKRYKVLTEMYLRTSPALDAPHGPMVHKGDILTAIGGWSTNWRQTRTADGHSAGWAFAKNLSAA